MAATLTKKSRSNQSRKGLNSSESLLPLVIDDGEQGDTASVQGSAAVETRGVELLVAFESLFRLLQPLVLGLAVNDLLNGSHRGLLFFAAQFLGYILVTTARQIAEAKREIDRDEAELRRGWSSSEANVSSAQQSQSSDWHDRASRIRTTITLVGVVSVLCLYDWRLLPLCLGILIPARLLAGAFRQLIQQHVSRLRSLSLPTSDEARSNPIDAEHRLATISERHRRLAETDAIRFALMELFVLGGLATALVLYITQGTGLMGGELRAGDVLAVFGYVLMFVEAVTQLSPPQTSQRATACLSPSHGSPVGMNS